MSKLLAGTLSKGNVNLSFARCRKVLELPFALFVDKAIVYSKSHWCLCDQSHRFFAYVSTYISHLC